MENNRTQSHRFLHSFCLNPSVCFETQLQNEQVLLVLRAHPFTQLPWMFYSIVMLILLFIINIVVSSFFSWRQILFMDSMALVFIVSYVWLNFLNWFFNVGVVTNIRIVDIDFTNAIYKEVTEAHLDKIEEITSKSGGFFASFFDFGNVYVETAGEAPNIEFINIPKPADVVTIIDGLLGK